MDNVTFRTARIEDLADIVAIYNESIPGRLATADTTPVSVAERKPWFAAHQTPGNGLWVMSLAGKTVGWISLSDFYGRPAYGHTKEVSIYLTNMIQHHHLGQTALDFMTQQAKELGVTTVLAFVFKHNTPSVKLFKRNHYATWGDLPEVAQMDGKLYSLLILGKQL